MPAAYSWTVVDGRREPVALADFTEYCDPATGLVRTEKLSPEWHAWQQLVEEPEFQRYEWELCRRDPWRFLVTWCWTFDTQDPEEPVKRFPAWPFLYDVVQAWIAGGDLFIDKPRAMLTTITISYLLGHGMEFEQGFTGSATSFTVPRVDDGGDHSSYNSIFGKFRFMHQLLPPFLRAPLDFRFKSITHKGDRTRSLSAETAGSKAGRGLQVQRFFADEIAYGTHSEAQVAAMDRACPRGKVFNGTPKGKLNAQHRLREDIKAGRNRRMRLVELKWWHHPDRRACVTCGSSKITTLGGTWHLPAEERVAPTTLARVNGLRAAIGLEILDALPAACDARDGLAWDAEGNRWTAPWYESARAAMTESLAAQELDVSYEESVEGRVYPIFRRQLFLRRDAGFKLDRAHVWSWDFGIDDFTACVMGQHKGGLGEIYDTYEKNGVGVEHYCTLFAWLTGQFHAAVLRDARGHPFCHLEDTWLPIDAAARYAKQWGPPGRYGLVKILHTADPSGAARESDLESWFSRFALGTWVDLELSAVRRLVKRGHQAFVRWLPDLESGRPVPPMKVGQVYMNRAPSFGLAEGIQTVTWALEHGRLRGLDVPRHGQIMGAGALCDAFEGYHRQTDSSGRVVVNKKPVHDQTSHRMDAARYWCLTVFGLRGAFIAAGRSR